VGNDATTTRQLKYGCCLHLAVCVVSVMCLGLGSLGARRVVEAGSFIYVFTICVMLEIERGEVYVEPHPPLLTLKHITLAHLCVMCLCGVIMSHKSAVHNT
jgi:hypothetical protein